MNTLPKANLECKPHDKWEYWKPCTCSAERVWSRNKMLQELLEKLAQGSK